MKIVLKYPKSHADYGLNEKFLGDSSESFTLALENCTSNINRTRKKRSFDESCSLSNHSMQDGQQFAALESAQNLLFNKFQAMDGNESLDEKTKILMNKCYSGINSQTKTLLEIRSSWPFLYTKSGFYQHYQQLVGKEMKLFGDNLANSLIHFLSYMQSLQSKNELKRMIRKINDAKQITKNNQPEIFGMLHLPCKYFREDISALVLKVRCF